MMLQHQTKSYAELLSPEQIDNLSPSACKLYEMIWNRMAVREAVEVSILDTHAMNKIKSDEPGLRRVQGELVRAGLIQVELVQRRKMTIEEFRTTYIYADQPEQTKDI